MNNGEKREAAYQNLAKILTMLGKEDLVQPIRKGEGFKPIGYLDGITPGSVKAGMIDIWAADPYRETPHHTGEKLYQNIKEIQGILNNAGINSELKDGRIEKDGDYTRLFIDIEQPDFNNKLVNLVEQNRDKIAKNLSDTDNEHVSVVDVVKSLILFDEKGKPLSVDQASSVIADSYSSLKDLANKLEISSAVGIKTSPRTGRSKTAAD